jgi:hypothetical protein
MKGHLTEARTNGSHEGRVPIIKMIMVMIITRIMHSRSRPPEGWLAAPDTARDVDMAAAQLEPVHSPLIPTTYGGGLCVRVQDVGIAINLSLACAFAAACSAFI